MPIVDESEPSVDDLVAFLRQYAKQDVLALAKHYPSEQTTLTVSFRDLRKAQPAFAEDYLTDPEHVTERLAEALDQYDLPIDVSLDDASVHLNDLPDEYVRTVGSYTPSEVRDRMVGIRGQVAKRSTKRMLITEAVFECQRCGTLITVPQLGDESLTEPHECSGCERQGPFRLDEDHSSVADHQLIRLQTPPDATLARENIDVTLTEDLVGEVDAGDRVVVNAMMNLVPGDDSESRLLDLMGEAHSIDALDAEYADLDVTPYLDRIREIASGEHPIATIVDSIAPSHFGARTIKTAIALQLFGGTEVTVDDGSCKRGTIHVFVVGDPGSGKSAILRYAEQLSPRSVYTAGKQTTTAGLTAAAVSDDFGDSGWTIEAGALVEATDGLCAIDELDDMAEETQAGLLEAMADQKVSVSKAGITTTLPAQTTVLAAANPIHGRFDQYESIADQIGVDPALLSRFDLIFTLSDSPDEETDRDIAHHILTSTQEAAADTETDGEGEASPALAPELLRAYIAHARTIDPVLTDAAIDCIEDEYVAVRQANDEDGPVPTTARTNHALRRLAGASARMCLSEDITVEDVELAIAIHREFLEGVGIDPETGEFDADIVETGASQSQHDRMKQMSTIIEHLEQEEQFDAGAPYEEICSYAADMDFTDEQVDTALEKLCRQGDAYCPQGGDNPTYRLT